MTNIAIEHGDRNSWFTQLENGDFPVRYVNVNQRVPKAPQFLF